MKRIINKLMSWSMVMLCGLVAFSSCSDDDESNSPYAGTDAHLLSLSLTTTDGTVYQAAITADTLTVSVPSNVSLDGATATYEVCEQATIIPDPATITDWDTEQLFRLVSYNGEVVENYVYVVNHEEVLSEGSVTLTTQTELDAFGAKGVNVIDGNLVIGSSGETDDPIVSMSALTSLTRIKGNLILLSSYEGGNLVGLDNITELGGIMVGTQDNLATITTDVNLSLPAVEQIGDIIINSNSVKTLELPAITSASRISVCSTALQTVDLSALAYCAGDFSFGFSASANTNKVLEELLCPALTEVDGNFTLQYMSALATTDFSALELIGGDCKYANLSALEAVDMPALSELSGGLTVSSVTTAPTVNFPKVPALESLTITAASMIESCDFSSLQSITGNFSITGPSPMIEEFSFPLLTAVGGTFTLRNLDGVTNLYVPELTEITGNITIGGMASLQEFSFPKLTTTASIALTLANLESFDMPSLTTFTGMTFTSMNSIEEIRFAESMSTYPGTLTLYRCSNVKKVYGPSVYAGNVTINMATTVGTPIPEFESSAEDGLVTMQGNFQIISTRYTEDFVWNNIKEVGGTLTLNVAPSLTLPDLVKVGSLTLNNSSGSSASTATHVLLLDMPKLETVTGNFTMGYRGVDDFNLPSLTTIGGNLVLGNTYSRSYTNLGLTNLDAFKSLTQVGGSVTIMYNTVLTDFSGLAGLVANFSGTWSVSNNAYNPTLADMKAGNYTSE